MNLYQISSEYENILNNLYDEEGNIDSNQLINLENNEIMMEKKVIAIASYIKNMDAEREAIELAKKSMDEREKRYKRKIESLKEYLQSNMENRGINNVSCSYFDIKLKKNPPSVFINDESILPEEYKKTKIEIVPDKVKIKFEISNGVVVPGASIKINNRLEIK